MVFDKLGKYISEGSDNIVYEDRENEERVIKISKKNNLNNLLDVIIKNNLKNENIMTSKEMYYLGNKLISYEEKCITLSEFLLSNRDLSFNKRINISLELIKSVTFLHSLGIIHCDIKPSNILLDKFLNLKINDFSSSRYCIVNESSSNKNLYTYLFRPNEIIQGLSPTYKSDIFALGCTIYFILNSENLFIKVNELKIALFRKGDSEINAFIKRMIDKNYNLRPELDEIIKFFKGYARKRSEEKKRGEEKRKKKKEKKIFSLEIFSPEIIVKENIINFCKKNNYDEKKFINNISGISKQDFTEEEIKNILKYNFFNT
jgi:serine/threonine protein kinase